MIDRYIPGFDGALQVLLGQPLSDTHFLVALVLGLLLIMVVFSKTLNSMGSQGVSFFGAMISAVLGLFVMIVGAALSTVYLKGAMGQTALIYLGVVLSSLTVIVPLLSFFLKNGYASVVSSWILATLSFVVLMLALSGIYEVIDSSGSITDSQQRRNAELDGLIDRSF